VYKGIFKQTNIVVAESLEEMFEYARIFDTSIKPKGKRIQVITNGGGFGVLSADSIDHFNLELAKMSESTLKKFKFPEYYVISNPLDLTGSASSSDFELSMKASLSDKNIDIVLVILLTQTPAIDPDITSSIIELNRKKLKPLIIITCGGDFTQLIKTNLEENGVPCFTYPMNAVKSIHTLCKYYLN